MKNKIVIAVGSNIDSPKGLNPIKNCNNAINELLKFNIDVIQKSSWYLSDPIPKSSQPKFYNSVLLCNTNHNANKILKIDIISFNENIINSSLLTIPHPRMHVRKFVLLPLFEIYNNWSHPLLKKNIRFLLEKVKHQKIKKLNID